MVPMSPTRSRDAGRRDDQSNRAAVGREDRPSYRGSPARRAPSWPQCPCACDCDCGERLRGNAAGTFERRCTSHWLRCSHRSRRARPAGSSPPLIWLVLRAAAPARGSSASSSSPSRGVRARGILAIVPGCGERTLSRSAATHARGRGRAARPASAPSRACSPRRDRRRRRRAPRAGRSAGAPQSRSSPAAEGVPGGRAL